MNAALQVHDSRFGFTSEQVDVIKATIAPGATNDELALFLMVCQKTGLDPFSRQIYLSERWANGASKKTPETTIDGFRVIAERSGKYSGQLGPYWCGSDGSWKDVWLSVDLPAAAKVGILRSDFKEPVWGIALFCEYAQYKKAKDGKPAELNSMWQKMGANQLAKCAESLGLRKAFPRDLSGMYTREEMQQASKDSEDNAKEAQQEVAQRKIKELTPQRVHVPEADGDGMITVVDGVPVVFKDKSYEDRHNAIILEANAVLDAPQPPVEAKPKGIISFAGLKKWRELKDELRKLTGTDAIYYGALKAKGYDHANQIANEKDTKAIWAVVAAERTRLKGEAELKATLGACAERLGGVRYLEILGANGCSCDSEALQLGGTPLDALLGELQLAVDDLKPVTA